MEVAEKSSRIDDLIGQLLNVEDAAALRETVADAKEATAEARAAAAEARGAAASMKPAGEPAASVK